VADVADVGGGRGRAPGLLFAWMAASQGYEILHNGVPRTFRDRRETALEAAQFAKSRAKGDIIELRDRATGEKLVMLADERVG
jgi:hypothetical protein